MEEKTFDYKGYSIEIAQDPDPLGPYEFNEDCFLVYNHRDFYATKDGFDPQEIFDEAWNKDQLEYEGYWIFGVDAYIHSGVSLAIRGSVRASSFPDRRCDVSFKGFALVSKEEWPDHKIALDVANDLINEWNDYLSGNVWSYIVDEESCSGFYGEEGYKQAIEEAKAWVDAEVRRRMSERVKKIKAWIRHRVPLVYRESIIYY